MNKKDAAMMAMVKRAGTNMDRFKEVRKLQATSGFMDGLAESVTSNFNPKNVPRNVAKGFGMMGKMMANRAKKYAR